MATIKQVLSVKRNSLSNIVLGTLTPITSEAQTGHQVDVSLAPITSQVQTGSQVDVTLPAITSDTHLINTTVVDAVLANILSTDSHMFVGITSDVDATLNAITGLALSSNLSSVDGTFSPLTSEASHTQTNTLTVDVSFSPITGQALTASIITGALNNVTSEVHVITGAASNVNKALKPITATVTLSNYPVANVDAVLSPLTSIVSAFQTVSITVDGILAPITSTANAFRLATASVDAVLSKLTSIATGFNPNNMTVDATLQSLTCDAHLISIAIGYLKTAITNIVGGQVTEYSNFDFDSMAVLGTKLVGVTSSGIYEITGIQDDGADIESVLRTAYMDIADSTLEKLRYLRTTVRSDGALTVELTSETGTIRTSTIPFFKDQLADRRVVLPKGMKDQYYSVGIKNAANSSMKIQSITGVTTLEREKV
jgi:hypothetical protein